MDNIVYEKAPLVELIVQLQWQVETIGIPGAPQVVTSNSVDFDLWFSNLTNSLRQEDYSQLERLTPSNIPSIAHQAIFRYRQEESNFPIIQFGHGIFTINTGPPSYQSWKEFRPIVESAINGLLTSAPSDASLSNFTNISMRYIDVFDEDLRENKSNYEFISNELGISLQFPFDIKKYTTDLNEINPTFAFNMPIKDAPERKLVFQISSGHVGKIPSALQTIMDLNYLVDSNIEKNTEKVLSLLDDSHKTLHEWFSKITKKIAARMSPKNSIGV